MKRKKVLITLLLCFLIGNKFCEGLPALPVVRKDNSYITATPYSDGVQLDRFVLQGTQTASTTAGIKRTRLLVEENADPLVSVYEGGHQAESTQGRDIADDDVQKRFYEATGKAESHENSRLKRLAELLRHASTAKPQENTLNSPDLYSAYETDGKSKTVVENDNYENGDEHWSQGGQRMTANKRSSRHALTGTRREKTLTSPVSTYDDHHKSEGKVEDDSDEDGSSKGSYLSGTERQRKLRERIHQGSSRHATSARPREDNVNSSDPAYESDHKSETIGEDNDDEDSTSEDVSSSGHASTAITWVETTNTIDSPNETVRNDTSEGSAQSGAGEPSSREKPWIIQKSKGKLRRLRLRTHQGASRHTTTATPRENNLTSTLTAYESDHKSKTIDEDNDDEDSASGEVTYSGHASTAIPWVETTNATDSSNETVRNDTSEGPSQSSAGEPSSRGNPWIIQKSKGKRRKLRVRTHQGSSTHATTARPREDNLTSTLTAYESDHKSETIDEDSVSGGVSSSGHASTAIPWMETTNTTDSSNETFRNDTSEGSSQGDSGKPSSRGKPWIIHQGPTRQVTSTVQHPGMAVRPEMLIPSAGTRWNAPTDEGTLIERRRYKKKKKPLPRKNEERHEEPVSPSNVAAIVAGLFAAAIVLLVIWTFLWRKCKDRFLWRGDPELGLATPSMTCFGEELSDEEIIFERKVSGSKNETNPGSSQSNTRSSGTAPSEQCEQSTYVSTHAPTTWTLTDTPRSTPLMTASTVSETPKTGVWLVNETSELKHLLSPSDTLGSSEQSCSPNETPPSASRTPSLASDLEIWISSKECHSAPESPNGFVPAESWTFIDKPEFTKLDSQFQNGPTNTAKDRSRSPPVDSSSLPNMPHEFICPVSMETSATSSSKESCKVPVSTWSDVSINIEDEEDSKWVVVSERECSIQEVQLRGTPRVETKADVDKEKGHKVATKTDAESESSTALSYDASSKPPLPPPPMKPLSATTKLRQGKSTIGGRKALGNRRFIKHLTSMENSSGFQDDLKKAVSTILMENESFIDKSKEKRKVVMEQTKEARTSMTECIISAKSIIMGEKMDSVRDKKSATRRRVIHKAQEHPAGSTLRPHSSLSQDIAFAQSVILPGKARQKAQRKTEERGKVIKEMTCQLKNPLFEDIIQIAASTINPDERTRDLNAKSAYKRSVIRMDAQMLKAQKKSSTFALDVKFGKNVICGPSTLDHEHHPQMGCLCYYCKRHWKKTGGPPCSKLPSAIAIAKDIVLIDGKLYFIRSKTSAARPRSFPSTPSAPDPGSDPCTSNANYCLRVN